MDLQSQLNHCSGVGSEELIPILRAHAQRYPAMEPTDAVKLVYQNEFGGGHMIRDVQSCLAYLRAEYAAVDKQKNTMCFEPIGNGIVRVHLAAVAPEDLEELGHLFIRSAAEHKGNLNSFLQKLTQLRQVTAEGIFSFDLLMLDAYLHRYQQAGYPAVSHSDAYRRAYAPAYRIVSR